MAPRRLDEIMGFNDVPHESFLTAGSEGDFAGGSSERLEPRALDSLSISRWYLIET
jgi:hypothetical protein